MTNESNGYEVQVVEFDETHERQVDAQAKSRPFYTLGTDGQPVQTGRIGLEDMGGTRRMFFHNSRGEEAPLGVMTKAFRIHDTFQVLRPIYDAGFTVQAINHTRRKGAGAIMMLTHPGIEFPDYMSWDEGFHSAEHTPLNPGILAWVDAREGKAYRFVGGFIRWYCTNGLVSQYLNLGQLKVSHKDVDPAGIHDFATQVAESAYEWTKPPEFDVRALEFPKNLVEQRILDTEVKFKQPRFIGEIVHSMESILPKWGWEALQGQYEMMLSGTDSVSAMDMVNAITNLNKGHQTGTIYNKLEKMTDNVMRLAELGAWKNDIEFPTLYQQTRMN